MEETHEEFAEFSLERKLKAKVEDVYKMFSDYDQKRTWFKGPNDAETSYQLDFKIGGKEYSVGKFHDGITHEFCATYYDIVPNKRIVYAYEMYLDKKRISVSVATITLKEDGDLTVFKLHESGVFLDNLDKSESRLAGSNMLMDSIVAKLESRG